MKNIGLILVLITLVFSSCKSLDDVRTKNRENLIHLEQGMSKQEVLDLMGTETQKTYAGDFTMPTGKINNPYRVEMYNADSSTFEILFYYTDVKSTDDAITDDELTPIVLRDNSLVGFGWSFWEGQIQKYEIRVR
ncbi:MAG: DUF3192 domain-containing protein [Balneolaceae bacterium]|nr:DUF3192 domain-containing protein [Balneolaceae bacterium]